MINSFVLITLIATGDWNTNSKMYGLTSQGQCIDRAYKEWRKVDLLLEKYPTIETYCISETAEKVKESYHLATKVRCPKTMVGCEIQMGKYKSF
jgi:hypothetical protein